MVHATPEQLAEMDDFVIAMHTRSGLLGEIEASTLSLEDAGARDARVPQAAHPRGTHGPPCRELHRHRPPLPGHAAPRDRGLPPLPLGGRLDASRSSADAGTPTSMRSAPEKKGGHRALQDIRESVAELAFYRGAVFNPAPAGHPPHRLRPPPTRRPRDDRGRRTYRGTAHLRTPGTPGNNQTATLSVAEADATLTAPGQVFEMQDRDIRGISTRTWKNAPETLRTVLDLSLGHGDSTFLVYEDERTSFADALPDRLHLGPPAAGPSSRSIRATGSPSPCGICPNGSWPSGPSP